MLALYGLYALVALIATYLFVVYCKEYSREENTIKELMKAQDKFAANQPLYFDIDPATAKELLKTYGGAQSTKKTSSVIDVEPTTKTKKIIN